MAHPRCCPHGKQAFAREVHVYLLEDGFGLVELFQHSPDLHAGPLRTMRSTPVALARADALVAARRAGAIAHTTYVAPNDEASRRFPIGSRRSQAG